MIIFNSRKMIFVHIHKAGGTTVEFSLAPLMRWDDILIGIPPFQDALDMFYRQTFKIDKHSRAEQICSVIGADLWKTYFSWATVRNPYERIASLYCYIAATIETRFEQDRIPNPRSHDDNMRWFESENYPKHAPWSYPAAKAYISTRARQNAFSEFLRSPALLVDPSFKPQYEFLCDHSGNELLVNMVVQVERLREGWGTILARIDAADLPLVDSNVTPPRWRRATNDLLKTRSDLDFVNERFGRDFFCFGYEMR